jgi:hypothetical protein
MAFMDFVEQHCCNAWEARVILNPSSQNAFGDDLNAGCRSSSTFIPWGVANGVAYGAPNELRHSLGSGAGC